MDMLNSDLNSDEGSNDNLDYNFKDMENDFRDKSVIENQSELDWKHENINRKWNGKAKLLLESSINYNNEKSRVTKNSVYTKTNTKSRDVRLTEATTNLTKSNTPTTNFETFESLQSEILQLNKTTKSINKDHFRILPPNYLHHSAYISPLRRYRQFTLQNTSRNNTTTNDNILKSNITTSKTISNTSHPHTTDLYQLTTDLSLLTSDLEDSLSVSAHSADNMSEDNLNNSNTTTTTSKTAACNKTTSNNINSDIINNIDNVTATINTTSMTPVTTTEIITTKTTTITTAITITTHYHQYSTIQKNYCIKKLLQSVSLYTYFSALSTYKSQVNLKLIYSKIIYLQYYIRKFLYKCRIYHFKQTLLSRPQIYLYFKIKHKRHHVAKVIQFLHTLNPKRSNRYKIKLYLSKIRYCQYIIRSFLQITRARKTLLKLYWERIEFQCRSQFEEYEIAQVMALKKRKYSY